MQLILLCFIASLNLYCYLDQRFVLYFFRLALARNVAVIVGFSFWKYYVCQTINKCWQIPKKLQSIVNNLGKCLNFIFIWNTFLRLTWQLPETHKLHNGVRMLTCPTVIPLYELTSLLRCNRLSSASKELLTRGMDGWMILHELKRLQNQFMGAKAIPPGGRENI